MAGGVGVLQLEVIDNVGQHRPDEQNVRLGHLCESITKILNMNQPGASYQGSRKAAATPTPAAKAQM